MLITYLPLSLLLHLGHLGNNAFNDKGGKVINIDGYEANGELGWKGPGPAAPFHHTNSPIGPH